MKRAPRFEVLTALLHLNVGRDHIKDWKPIFDLFNRRAHGCSFICLPREMRSYLSGVLRDCLMMFYTTCPTALVRAVVFVHVFNIYFLELCFRIVVLKRCLEIFDHLVLRTTFKAGSRRNQTANDDIFFESHKVVFLSTDCGVDQDLVDVLE